MTKKYLLALIVLPFILASCRMSTEALEEAVKKDITETLEQNRSNNTLGTLWENIGVDSSIKVKSVDLVHQQGNNYTGFVTIETNIGGYITEEKYTLEVVYDGFKTIWQIKNIAY